jgi:translation initiation factor 2 subunit 2
MKYEEMLKKAREQLPESVHAADRFEVPKVRGHLQGSKTVLSNFNEISSILGRESNHLLKFILKELATPGEMKNNGLVIMGSKVAASRINDKIKQYARIFVICNECGKPDTKIIKEKEVSFMKCQACGAKNPIHSKF